jgi:hypothetical protein
VGGPVRGLSRAAVGARNQLLRGRRGGRSRRAGGAAGPRPGAPRRRRQQGARPRTCAPRPRQGGAHAHRGPARRHQALGGFTSRREEVNGAGRRDGPRRRGGLIQAVSSIVNPDKLRHLGGRWPTWARCAPGELDSSARGLELDRRPLRSPLRVYAAARSVTGRRRSEGSVRTGGVHAPPR